MLGFKPMIIPNIWGCETWDDNELAISVGRLYTFNAKANEWDAQPLEIDRGPVRLTILPNRTVDLVGRWSEDYTLRVNSLRVVWNGDKPSAPTKAARYHGRLWFAQYVGSVDIRRLRLQKDDVDDVCGNRAPRLCPGDHGRPAQAVCLRPLRQ